MAEAFNIIEFATTLQLNYDKTIIVPTHRQPFSKIKDSIADEALQLLAAPNCPTGKMDVLLAPDQMVLQIHESIGHPLEMDRILGDERNYAGTTFVTMDMLGSYQYGSKLLSVLFIPLSVPVQITQHDEV